MNNTIVNSPEGAYEIVNKPAEGLRYNEGKLRYDLLEPYAIRELVRVFTKGAEKYEQHNWLKGMDWSKCLASLKRHIAAFELGEDRDSETGCFHMAHAAWNALALVSYMKYAPGKDDRLHHLFPKKKVALDVDEVVCNWVEHWCEYYKIPIPSSWYFQWDISGLFNAMKADGKLDEFYAGLTPKINFDEVCFEPVAYISHRPVAEEITRAWLEAHGFPLKPVIHVKERADKVRVAKELGVDIFVDDSYETFQAMNAAGITCFLMDAKHNRRYDVGFKRITNLNQIFEP